MRQFTIAEWVIAAALLPLAAILAASWLSAAIAPFLSEVVGIYAGIAIGIAGLGLAIAAVFAVVAGRKAISGEIVRDGGDNYGVCFTPARLRLEELRDLVTAPGAGRVIMG